MCEQNITQLPDEMIDEILLRLPSKSIGRFKCVSKSWRSLLSSPRFFNRHLVFAEDNFFLQLWRSRPWVRLTLTTKDGYDGVVRNLKLPYISHDEPKTYLSGSCHGLVVLMQRHEDILGIVFNLATLETIPIPKNVNGDRIGIPVRLLGIGYDKSKKDYKIVSHHRGNHVSVYSLKNKTWRSLETPPPFEEPLIASYGAGAFVGDCLHWAYTLPGHVHFVAAFNLVTDTFEDVPFPQGFQFNPRAGELTVIGGCLAMVVLDVYYTQSNSVHVWIMKEYGVQDSWTKFTIHPPHRQVRDIPAFRMPIRILSFLNENEILLLGRHDNLIVYDWTNGLSRYMSLGYGTPVTCVSK